MSAEEHKTYVIKKIKKVHKGGHHGGSWKIAYADFVTAMMTFFLLMWLLSLLNKSQLEAIAAYFKTPLKAAFTERGAIHVNSQSNRIAKPVTEVKTNILGDKGSGTKENPGQFDKSTQFDKDKKANADQEAKGNKPKTDQEVNGSKPKTLTELKEELEKKIQSDPNLSQYKNMLNFVVTADGLKIDMHDLDNKSMFSSGKTDFAKYAGELMKVLATELNQFPNQIEIIGHTDAKPYADSANYGNWELSADRANATRRALESNGMSSNKILRIIGVGPSDPANKKDPNDPLNRRIEIIVLSDHSMKKIGK